MSRKMGTGAVSFGAGDSFSIRAGGIFAGEPIGPRGAVWADSRPVKAIHKIAIWPARMQSDCSAISRQADSSIAIVILSEAKDDKLLLTNYHYDKPSLGILERISARFVPRHEPGVVFEQVVQVLGIGWERLSGIRIGSHVAEWQRVHRIAAVGVEVHIFFVSVGNKEIIAYPAARQGGQLRRIEIERNFIARPEDGKFVVDRFEQRPHIAVTRVSASRTRVRAGGAGLFVNVLHVARRPVFNLQRESVEIQFSARQRYQRQAGALILAGAVDQNVIPVDLQVSGNANAPRARRKFASEIGGHGARASGGESQVIDNGDPFFFRAISGRVARCN